jgi:virulence-associated protein VapD
MTLQEVWKIKAEKSQITKDMTTRQLKEYYSNSLREFYKIIGKQLDKTAIDK